MLLHILKIIRTELRSNLWVLAELLVVSVVLWISIDYFSAQYQLYHKPVGYETEHVYEAVVSMKSVESPSFITYEQGSEEPYPARRSGHYGGLSVEFYLFHCLQVLFTNSIMSS